MNAVSGVDFGRFNHRTDNPLIHVPMRSRESNPAAHFCLAASRVATCNSATVKRAKESVY
jgi:hypothetical protein